MMQRKMVLFIADSLDNAHKFQSVLSGLDVDVVAGSSAQFKKLLAQHPSHDLVIYEARGDALDTVAQAERSRKSAQAQNEHSRKPQGGATRKQAGATKPKGDFRPGRAHRAEVARQHSKHR